MANFNRIILVGNLTRDPQLKYLPSQTSVVEFGLAVNHKYRTKTGEDREEVLFIECACFGKGGEIINQYCQKGRPILVEGRLKFDTWEDKQGGGKRSKHSVVVENFQLLGSRDGGAGAGGGSGGGSYSAGGGDNYSAGAPAYEGDAPSDEHRPAPAARPAPQRPPVNRGPAPAPKAPPAEPPFGEEQQFKEDDIPF